jgi:multidrug resistance efflux pump
MLNLSNNSINHLLNKEKHESINKLRNLYSYSQDKLVSFMIILLMLFAVIMFMPWTQNVRAKGQLISLQPESRPQMIESVIAGKIQKWYVAEGQFVNKGDTILQISEVKDEYFDPQLLENTKLQLEAKKFSKLSYEEKVAALDGQIIALKRALDLKLNQTKNKVRQGELKMVTDSIDLSASKINFEVAREQYQRFKKLYDEGLRSLTDLENRQVKMQEAQAKFISQENKYLISKNELLNAKIDLNSVLADYQDKIAKANSDKFSAISGKYDTDATINKIQNQYNNYKVRLSQYFVLAPQNGFITQARQTGLGQIVKEGEEIVSIMPENYNLAIQMYIKPLDLPLFEKGQKVMIQFDGWPAIIFSGWPGVSFGTFEGHVLAIDNFTSDNQLYRVLVVPAKGSSSWPEQLKFGAGVKTITLLKNVSVWYEIWRQINGFPPDYYKLNTTIANDKTKK